MNWEAAGAVGEILGAALVVITLLYLARQVRLNTKAVISDTYQAHMDAWHALSAMIIENPQVAELLRMSEDEPAELSQTDQIRFEYLASKIFGLWEHWHVDYQAGMISNADAESWSSYFRDHTNTRGFRKFWKSCRHWYSPEFVAHVNRVFATADAPTGEPACKEETR